MRDWEKLKWEIGWEGSFVKESYECFIVKVKAIKAHYSRLNSFWEIYDPVWWKKTVHQRAE